MKTCHFLTLSIIILLIASQVHADDPNIVDIRDRKSTSFQVKSNAANKTNNSSVTISGDENKYSYKLKNGWLETFNHKDGLYVLVPEANSVSSNKYDDELNQQFNGQLIVKKEHGLQGYTIFSLDSNVNVKTMLDSIQTSLNASFISPLLSSSSKGGQVAVSRSIVVRFKAGTSTQSQLSELALKYDISKSEALRFTDLEYVLHLGPSFDSAGKVFKLTNELSNIPTIEWSEPNFIVAPASTQFTPNDTLFSDQWHLDNTGQNEAKIGADIDAIKGWELSKGNGTVIAIYDDGVQLTHPDLNIWQNPDEIANNGIDDDGNGYIDDLNGWDFMNEDNNPNPSLTSDNHGTSVAGVAAAVGDNGIGVSGSAPEASILAIRSGSMSCASYGEAMRYAGKYADVVNNSWSISSCQSSLESAIDDVVSGVIPGARRGSKGTPVVYASGNDASGWVKFSVAVRSGIHTFEWSYDKDYALAEGLDTAWVDDITWPNGTVMDFESDVVGSIPSGFSGVGNSPIRVSSDGEHARGGVGKSVKAGVIDDEQSSGMSITKSIANNGVITFWAWVSSELNYDGLRFKIDGVEEFFYTPGQYIHANGVAYPASYEKTISVGAGTDGAISGEEERIYYSQFGPELDVIAPSGNQNQGITTTDRTGTNGYNSSDYTGSFGGTSSAAPLAAGVVANIIALNPSLTATEVRQVLRDGADKIGPYAYTEGRNNYYGHGRINMYSSLALANPINPDNPVIYEDAEDGAINGWTVYDNTPIGSSISNIYDFDRDSQVIKLLGDGTSNGYRLRQSDGKNWGNTYLNWIQWTQKFTENYRIYVGVETDLGWRYLVYLPEDGGITQSSNLRQIYHRLGRDLRDGSWQTITRDLEADLKALEPDNNIISVEQVLIRGSGLLDDIQLLPDMPSTVVYEDAEDGLINGWTIYDGIPAGATINNNYDSSRGSQVIQLSGDGISNGYRLRQSDGSNWGSTGLNWIQWSQNFSENHRIYIGVETDLGWRYLVYLPIDGDSAQSSNLRQIYHRIGVNFQNGSWQTITRNLEIDLKALEPNNNIISVEQLLVRGSGLIDDIQLLPSIPVKTYENAEDGLISGWDIHDASPVGAAISNIYDESQGNRVIQLSGSGVSNGYRLRQSDGSDWGNTTQNRIQWTQKFSENHRIYVRVDTELGWRYLVYLPADGNSRQSSNLRYVYHWLGENFRDGTWQTVTRSLESDLRALEPDNRIISVDQFLVRGSGSIDNIKLSSD